jgi:HEAT repeat protein
VSLVRTSTRAHAIHPSGLPLTCGPGWDRRPSGLSLCYALGGQNSPRVTAALLDLLADNSEMVRSAAAHELAGPDSPQVTAALLDRLSDESKGVQSVAAKALSESRSPQALLAAVTEIPKLSPSCWPAAAQAVERLMYQHYLRIDPAERSAVRTAVARFMGAHANAG